MDLFDQLEKEKEKKGMKYCSKHNQYFMAHVKKCPICVGEKMSPASPKEES